MSEQDFGEGQDFEAADGDVGEFEGGGGGGSFDPGMDADSYSAALRELVHGVVGEEIARGESLQEGERRGEELTQAFASEHGVELDSGEVLSVAGEIAAQTADTVLRGVVDAVRSGQLVPAHVREALEAAQRDRDPVTFLARVSGQSPQRVAEQLHASALAFARDSQPVRGDEGAVLEKHLRLASGSPPHGRASNGLPGWATDLINKA